jgi:hypothetical protein
VRGGLENLLRAYGRTSASSINLVWAYFGAGKTHFLKYLGYRMDSLSNTTLRGIYSVFPKSIRGYLDLYRVFAAGIPADQLRDAYRSLEQAGDHAKLDPEVFAACKALVLRPDQADIVMQWLRAQRPLLSALRQAGLHTRIDTAERAIEVQSSLVRLIQATGVHRLVWMVDEFQRIGELGISQKNDVNVGLHSLFNELPTGFSLFLSFSFGEPKNIKYLLSDELIDRSRLQQYFQLPPLSRDEAVAFVREVMQAHCISEAWREPDGPFGAHALGAVVEAIDASPQLALKPRTLMQVFDAILSEADWRIESGELQEVDSTFALGVLKERLDQAVFVDEDSE